MVTLDLGLPPDPGGVSAGFGLLEQILNLTPHCKIIVITGQEDREHALKAIASGAYDYYQKPVDQQVLSFIADRAFKLAEIESENRSLKAFHPMQHSDILTNSPGMIGVCRTVEKVAPTDLSVLIQGETGTGKELIAQDLHKASKRANHPA